ncbi:hypothetical protein K490DRAFT_63996 [Saccharata proteae CBS 121410]|uniref:Uncharacterized protein n=1 Tax=Saccharata proteae CBS 121410 TaxID=1314787 RepID=A0A6A5YBA9_9PEZI|nr:hypothetical protein K490DRAFT_63996 [Saccharata proteae CBS 121410]
MAENRVKVENAGSEEAVPRLIDNNSEATTERALSPSTVLRRGDNIAQNNLEQHNENQAVAQEYQATIHRLHATHTNATHAASEVSTARQTHEDPTAAAMNNQRAAGQMTAAMQMDEAFNVAAMDAVRVAGELRTTIQRHMAGDVAEHRMMAAHFNVLGARITQTARRHALEQLRQRIQTGVAIENLKAQDTGVTQYLMHLEAVGAFAAPGHVPQASIFDVQHRKAQEAEQMNYWTNLIMIALADDDRGQEMGMMNPIRAALLKMRNREALGPGDIGVGHHLTVPQISYLLDECLSWIDDTFHRIHIIEDDEEKLEVGQPFQPVAQQPTARPLAQQPALPPAQQPAHAPAPQQATLFIRTPNRHGGIWEIPAGDYDISDLESERFLSSIALGFEANAPDSPNQARQPAQPHQPDPPKRRAESSPAASPAPRKHRKGHFAHSKRAERKAEKQQQLASAAGPAGFQAGPVGFAAPPGTVQASAGAFAPPSMAVPGGLQAPRGPAAAGLGGNQAPRGAPAEPRGRGRAAHGRRPGGYRDRDHPV